MKKICYNSFQLYQVAGLYRTVWGSSHGSLKRKIRAVCTEAAGYSQAVFLFFCILHRPSGGRPQKTYGDRRIRKDGHNTSQTVSWQDGRICAALNGLFRIPWDPWPETEVCMVTDIDRAPIIPRGAFPGIRA